ncbi:MAG: efflux RND transporter periplasmic adaptor subunit [Elusimicrobiota bacterium]
MKFLSNLKKKIVAIIWHLISSAFIYFRKSNYKKKLVIIVSVLLLLTLLFVVAKHFIFKPKEKKEEKAITRVKVEKLTKGDFSQKYPVMGTIKGTTENDLRFAIEGVLLKYNYREGARITRDNTIAYLNSEDTITKISYAKSKFESEKAAYFSTKQRLKVYEELFVLKSISESKLLEIRFEAEAARQKMETALAELDLAQSNLLKTNLSAPSNGILAEIIIQAGEYVTPNDVVAKYVSIGDVNLEVEIPEKDTEQIKIGMNTKVLCDSYPNKEFIGAVTEIAPTVKERTRTVIVKIRLPNPEGLLRSGMFARGDILISEASSVIAVISDSLVSLGEVTKLLPLVKPVEQKQDQGIVELRQIKIGSVVGKLTIITDGIKEGELYITETSGELSDGLLVDYVEPIKPQQ